MTKYSSHPICVELRELFDSETLTDDLVFERALDKIEEALDTKFDPITIVRIKSEERAMALEEAAKVADGFYLEIRQYTTDVPDIGEAIRSLIKQNCEDTDIFHDAEGRN